MFSFNRLPSTNFVNEWIKIFGIAQPILINDALIMIRI